MAGDLLEEDSGELPDVGGLGGTEVVDEGPSTDALSAPLLVASRRSLA